MRTLHPGSFSLSGYLGERIDTVAHARITDPENRRRIYPEVEEAYRARVDDRLVDGAGKWQGEVWGKGILSAVEACRYYGDDELRDFIAESAHAVIATQDESGYIGTYSDSTFFGPKTWNIWGRKYTLWGLIECYRLIGDRELLDAAVRFIDHLQTEVGPGKADIITTGQLVGLPSTSILGPVVMLHKETGEQRFLDYAAYIVDQWSKHPDGPPDILRQGLTGAPIHTWFDEPEQWAKSYEFTSCVEGLLELYEVTGTDDYLTVAKNIHAQVADWERSPAGSVSFNDKYVGSRYLRNTVAEICDVVYWNRLSFKLFSITGDVAYLDEIERSLYNSLLVGASRDGSWGLRRLRFTHRHIEAHPQSGLEHHHCCVDNLPRALFQAASGVLWADDDGVRVALLNPGSGRVAFPAGGEIEVVISGDYPFSGDIKLTVRTGVSRALDLAIRIPEWARGESIAVDGQPRVVDGSGWLTVRRVFAPESSISLALPMRLRLEWFEPAADVAARARSTGVGPDSAMLPDSETIEWHEDRFWRFGYMVEQAGKPMGQQVELSPADVQPDRRAGILFYGPIALGLDRRAIGASPFEDDRLPLGEADLRGASVEVTHGDLGPTYRLSLADGRTVDLLAFESLGATWDEESEFSVWGGVDR